MPYEEAKKEAETYVQVIRDASSYAFNKSHAVAYSMLGYVFAYMKHYHPEEYICAFLNYANNEDDIINGTKLALQRQIKIQEPIFRYGRGEYSFDKDNHIIYKGMGSIKYLNQTLAEELYQLRNNKYNNFFALLEDIKLKTSVNSRQLDILIKLDFFKEFGNSKLLLRYVDLYNKFCNSQKGYLKSINKNNNFGDLMNKIISRYSKETNTRYQILDIYGIFLELNDLLQSSNIIDFSIKDKVATQLEYLGYIGIKTEKPEDRTKLIIMDVIPLRAKKGKQAGQVWARIIKTHSVGRGIDGEFMIKETDYQSQYHFNKNDIINIYPETLRQEIYLNRKQYWIRKYDVVI